MALLLIAEIKFGQDTIISSSIHAELSVAHCCPALLNFFFFKIIILKGNDSTHDDLYHTVIYVIGQKVWVKVT